MDCLVEPNRPFLHFYIVKLANLNLVFVGRISTIDQMVNVWLPYASFDFTYAKQTWRISSMVVDVHALVSYVFK